MKKVYVKPVVETIEVKVENMIAQSNPFDNSIPLGGELDPDKPAESKKYNTNVWNQGW